MMIFLPGQTLITIDAFSFPSASDTIRTVQWYMQCPSKPWNALPLGMAKAALVHSLGSSFS